MLTESISQLLQDPLLVVPGRAAELVIYWHSYWNTADVVVDSDGMTPLMQRPSSNTAARSSLASRARPFHSIDSATG